MALGCTRRSQARCLCARASCAGAVSLFIWRTLRMCVCAAVSSSTTSTRPSTLTATRYAFYAYYALFAEYACYAYYAYYAQYANKGSLLLRLLRPLRQERLPATMPTWNTSTRPSLPTATDPHNTNDISPYQEIPDATYATLNLTEYSDFQPASTHPSKNAQRAGMDPIPPAAAAAAAAGKEVRQKTVERDHLLERTHSRGNTF